MRKKYFVRFMLDMNRLWPSLALITAVAVGALLTPIEDKNLALFGVILPSFCLFRAVTGLPCPFCGISRSFVNLVHGNWQSSLASHPLGPFLFIAFFLYSVYRLIQRKNPPFFNEGLAGLFALFVLVWAVRFFIPGSLTP